MEKIDNERDTVTFYDMKGKSAGEFGLLHDADNLLQNTYGIFLDERTFVLSTNGQHTVLKYLMETGFSVTA
jgi:ABC-type cobalamin/Fe3+-siderophores transport system ATPase subunit